MFPTYGFGRRRLRNFRKITSEPVQLTTGPLSFSNPVPSKDGNKLFVIGEKLRGELVRYDAGSRQFMPYLGGISASEVEFSVMDSGLHM